MPDFQEANIRLMTKNLVEAYMEILSSGYAVSVQDFLLFRNYANTLSTQFVENSNKQPQQIVHKQSQKTNVQRAPITASNSIAKTTSVKKEVQPSSKTAQKSDFDILKGVKDEWN